MYEVGMDIGIAFQIKDDLFDYGRDDVGKPRRNDIRERKVTLPFIKAMENATFAERTHIRYLMWKRKKKRRDIDTIVHFVHQKGGIEYSGKIMHEYAARARRKLAALPPSPARKNFANLIEFIINRKK
jgi:octaprenyl-diphosphate synthase